MLEFVLWGNPPGHDATFGKALLVTGLKSREAAEKARALLERDHGVRDIEMQTLDGTLPDFGRECLNI